MSALDRKVVHDAAAEIDGVATESQGEEPRRRVVLIPAVIGQRGLLNGVGPGPAPGRGARGRASDAGSSVPNRSSIISSTAGISPTPSAGSPGPSSTSVRAAGPGPRARARLARRRRGAAGFAAATLRASSRTPSQRLELEDRLRVDVRAGRGSRPSAGAPGDVRPGGRPLVRAPGGDRRMRGGVPPRWRQPGGHRATGGDLRLGGPVARGWPPHPRTRSCGRSAIGHRRGGQNDGAGRTRRPLAPPGRPASKIAALVGPRCSTWNICALSQIRDRLGSQLRSASGEGPAAEGSVVARRDPRTRCVVGVRHPRHSTGSAECTGRTTCSERQPGRRCLRYPVLVRVHGSVHAIQSHWLWYGPFLIGASARTPAGPAAQRYAVRQHKAGSRRWWATPRSAGGCSTAPLLVRLYSGKPPARAWASGGVRPRSPAPPRPLSSGSRCAGSWRFRMVVDKWTERCSSHRWIDSRSPGSTGSHRPGSE